jgi:hypothetical protein
MIDILGFVDKIFSAISITKSASDLSDEVDKGDSKTDSQKQNQEAIAQQRYESMKSERKEQLGHQAEEQLRQKR